MIYCPDCETANRDGSRFCNNCGADLSTVSGRRCPMCSTMNPEERTVCDKCGARLVPQTEPLSAAETPRPEPAEGLPFPVEGPSAEQEAETADWLQQLRASTGGPADEKPAMPEVEPAEPTEEIPDWLKEIRPPEETKPRVPPMAWEEEAEMRGGAPSLAVAPYPSGEEEPDWLKRLRAASVGMPAPTEEPVMPPSPPPSPIEVPSARGVSVPPQEEGLGADWLERLRQTMPEETPPAGVSEAAPPVFEEALAPPFPMEVEPEEAVPAEEIPDWLQGLRPEPEAPPTPTEAPPLAVEEEAEEEIPDWLQRLRPEPEVPTIPMEAEAPPLVEEAAPTEEIPDWLQGLRPEPEAPPTPMEAPPLAVEEEAEEEIPDWLQRLRPEPEAPTTPVEAEAPPLAEEAALSEEIPDWLQGLRPEPEAPPMPVEAGAPPLAVEEEAEEIPEWLQDLRPEPEAPPTPVEAPPLAVEEEAEEEIPDWLQRLRPEAEVPTTPMEAEAPPLAEEATPEEGGPDWLQGLRPEPEAPPMPMEAPPLAVEEEAEEEIPDWLQRLRPEAEVPTTPMEAEAPPLATEIEEEEIPGWLREFRSEPETPPMPVEAGAPPLVVEEEAEEIPEWLQELRLESEAPPTMPAEAPLLAEEPGPEEEIPEWLQGLGPISEAEEVPPFGEAKADIEEIPPAVEAEVPELLKEPGPTPEGEVAEAETPEWLHELHPSELAAEEAVETPPTVLGVEVPSGEVPDWLKELGPPVSEEETAFPPPVTMKEVVPPAVAEEAPEVEGLAQAEIPAWLQGLRPREVKESIVEVPEIVEAVETTGLLAGIQGVLPVEPIVSGPHKAAPAPTAAVTVGPEQADLFKEIITQGPAPVTEAVAPRRTRIREGLLRGFIYLLVALAVIVPLYGVGDWFGQAELPTGAVTDFYDVVQSLEPDSVVLLVFDYDPSTAAEMDRLAEPVLWHLMDRKVKLMAISLLPTGPAVAGNLLDRVAGAHGGGYQYGQDYVNLGYIPGQAAAPNELASDLRALVPQDYRQGKSLSELPATQKVNGIQNVSLIIEFAARQRTLRWWIEQVGSQYQVEIMAAVSAAVEPTAKPYHNSGQLVGLISGLPSAAQYETKTSKWPSLYIASVDAQSVAHLAIVALIVLGSLASLGSARRK